MKVPELRFLYMQKIFLTERGHRSTAVRCQRQVLIKLYIAGCVYEQMDFVKEQEGLRRRSRRTFASDDYGKRQ